MPATDTEITAAPVGAAEGAVRAGWFRRTDRAQKYAASRLLCTVKYPNACPAPPSTAAITTPTTAPAEVRMATATATATATGSVEQRGYRKVGRITLSRCITKGTR